MSTYATLLKSGWKMKDIDESDLLGFLKIRAWDERRTQKKNKPKRRYIDEVWPDIKS